MRRRGPAEGCRGRPWTRLERHELSLGAGYCNQLQFSADALGVTITTLGIDVELLVNDLVAGATIRVAVDVESGEDDAARLLEHATAESTISNSVVRGFPVKVERSVPDR